MSETSVQSFHKNENPQGKYRGVAYGTDTIVWSLSRQCGSVRMQGGTGPNLVHGPRRGLLTVFEFDSPLNAFMQAGTEPYSTCAGQREAGRGVDQV